MAEALPGAPWYARYAHLSPSYLQEAFEKVPKLGKLEATKPEGKQDREQVNAIKSQPSWNRTGNRKSGTEERWPMNSRLISTNVW